MLEASLSRSSNASSVENRSKQSKLLSGLRWIVRTHRTGRDVSRGSTDAPELGNPIDDRAWAFEFETVDATWRNALL